MSKKERKRLCPFSSAKAPKRKISKVFHKEWAEALATVDKGSYFEQDNSEEQDEAVPVFNASRLKLKGKCSEGLQKMK